MSFITPLISRSKKIIPYYKAHKIIGTCIALALVGVLYLGYSAVFAHETTTQYVLSRVTRGDIETTVAGTGQVAATNQIDIKARASGDITYVGAVAGQTMKAGQIIARLDTTDASIALQNARISLAKLTKPVEQSTLLSSQNSLADAEASVISSYVTAKNSIAAAYLEISEITASIHDVLYTSSGFLHDTNITSHSNFIRTNRDEAGILFDKAVQDITHAKKTYIENLQTNNKHELEIVITETYDALSTLSNSLKMMKITVDSIKSATTDSKNTAAAVTVQTDISSWTTKVHSHMSNLLNARQSMDSAERSVLQRKESLLDTESGADTLDIQSAQLNVQQRLADYEKYIIRAPFDGVLASLDVKKGDSASGATIGVFITKQKVAEITLNEIDAAKVTIGQPVTLTFDAVEDLIATGTVASIDLIGTVTQGVVNYTTKIAFDVQDERIKPGMSVSATIVTSNKKDVLLVPSTAVKTRGDQSYVEIAEITMPERSENASTTMSMRNASSTFASTSSSTMPRRQFTNQTPVTLPSTPTQVFVTIGMTDNTQTEILTGLTEGQFVVSKTVSSTSTTAATTQSGSLFNIGGGARTGTQRPGGNIPR